jgi:hypothetical protein
MRITSRKHGRHRADRMPRHVRGDVRLTEGVVLQSLGAAPRVADAVIALESLRAARLPGERRPRTGHAAQQRQGPFGPRSPRRGSPPSLQFPAGDRCLGLARRCVRSSRPSTTQIDLGDDGMGGRARTRRRRTRPPSAGPRQDPADRVFAGRCSANPSCRRRRGLGATRSQAPCRSAAPRP